MGKYLKKFETHTEYEAFTATSEFIKPNVSLCVEENEVHYNPYVHDYSQDYLTFEALEDGTFQFIKPINYSIDNGNTWVALAADTSTPTITSGDKIMWKATLTPSYSGIGTFSSTGNFNVEGNPMSLLYGDNFVGQTDLTGKDNALATLFYICSKLINAKNLSLPATTLANQCYDSMFRGCTSLTTAPELPATTLANQCYDSMFRGCTSLTTAPQLPATTLAKECYYDMFYGCTSLNYIKAMFTTTPSNTYTSNWVSGVAASGTFVKNSAATWTTTGVNGIPSGWTVQTASA